MKLIWKEKELVGKVTVEWEVSHPVFYLEIEKDIEVIKKDILNDLIDLDIVFEKNDEVGMGNIWFSDFHHQKNLARIEISTLVDIAPFDYQYISFVFRFPSKTLKLNYPGHLDFSGDFYKAIQFFEDKEWKKVLELLLNIKGGEKIFNLYNLAGYTSKLLNYFKSSQEYYRKELLSFRHNNVCWSNLGILYRQIGEVEASIDCFQKSLLLDPLEMEPLFSAVSTFSLFPEKHKLELVHYFYLIYLFFSSSQFYRQLLGLLVKRLNVKEDDLIREIEENNIQFKPMLLDFYQLRKYYTIGLEEEGQKLKTEFLQKHGPLLLKNRFWGQMVEKFLLYREQFSYEKK